MTRPACSFRISTFPFSEVIAASWYSVSNSKKIASAVSVNFEISREYCGEICLVTKGDSSQKTMFFQAFGLLPSPVTICIVSSSSIEMPSVCKSDCISTFSILKVTGEFTNVDNSELIDSLASSTFLFVRDRLPISTFGAILFALILSGCRLIPGIKDQGQVSLTYWGL